MKKTLGQIQYETGEDEWRRDRCVVTEIVPWEKHSDRARQCHELAAQAVLKAAGVDAELVKLLRELAAEAGWDDLMDLEAIIRAKLSRIEAALRGEVAE